jgi:hypothetical protein
MKSHEHREVEALEEDLTVLHTIIDPIIGSGEVHVVIKFA